MIHLIKLLAYVCIGEFAALGNLNLPFNAPEFATIYLGATLLVIAAIAVIAADSLFHARGPRQWIKHLLRNLAHGITTPYALLSLWLWNTHSSQAETQSLAVQQMSLNALFILANAFMLYSAMKLRAQSSRQQ